MPVTVAPDVEKIVIDWLKAHPDVLATAASDRSFSRIPDDPVYPLATVQAAGGPGSGAEPAGWLKQRRVQIDVYGTTKGDARTVAGTIQAALHQLPGARPGGVVTAVRDEVDLQWLPDEPTGRPRYVYVAIVFVHP